MRSAGFLAMASLIVLAACQDQDTTTEVVQDEPPAVVETEAAQVATATLLTAEGEPAGTVTATASPAGLVISLDAVGISPGQHGVHVHTTGSCEGPTFQSAGGHWNPTDRMHGLDSEQGAHAGDMPNLIVDADGTGALEYTLGGGTFAELLDADGAAFIIHAEADDQMTDPSGESGDRIACGVFSEGAGAA